jgi:hypothetical protein
VIRYVLLEMDVEDWGAVDPALYVEQRDLRGFMGTIRAVETSPPLEVMVKVLRKLEVARWHWEDCEHEGEGGCCLEADRELILAHDEMKAALTW